MAESSCFDLALATCACLRDVDVSCTHMDDRSPSYTLRLSETRRRRRRRRRLSVSAILYRRCVTL